MSANQLNQNALVEVIRRYRKQKGMTQDADFDAVLVEDEQGNVTIQINSAS
ncbi:MAG: hypothetical protein IIX86_05185 [Clostridia bacterium]|nr:hypothetical protein [Clostridia bacterium]